MFTKKSFEEELSKSVSKLTIHKRFDKITIDLNAKYRDCIFNDEIVDEAYKAVVENSDESSNDYYEKLAIDAMGVGMWISYCCKYDDIFDAEELKDKLPEHLTTIINCVKQNKMFRSMFTFLLGIMRIYEEIDGKELEIFSKKIAKVAKDNGVNTKEYFKELYYYGSIIYWSGLDQE